MYTDKNQTIWRKILSKVVYVIAGLCAAVSWLAAATIFCWFVILLSNNSQYTPFTELGQLVAQKSWISVLPFIGLFVALWFARKVLCEGLFWLSEFIEDGSSSSPFSMWSEVIIPSLKEVHSTRKETIDPISLRFKHEQEFGSMSDEELLEWYEEYCELSPGTHAYNINHETEDYLACQVAREEILRRMNVNNG